MRLLRPPSLRYGVAITTSALALLLAWAFYPMFEPIPGVPVFAAVAISAWYGGLGPGLLATVLATLAATYLFLADAPFTLAIDSPITAARVGGLGLVAAGVAWLTASLRAAGRRALDALAEVREAVRVRDEFLSSVSHDLRSPLTTIRGMAQLLERQAREADALEGRRALKGLALIITTATRMQAQIDDLADLARLQAGQSLELRPSVTDLVALAREVAAAQQLTTQRHRIVVEAAQRTLHALVDPPRVERVLNNLLSNAIKYSPHGGDITVSVSREHDSVRAWAVVRVRDQGVGIPAAELHGVFERFRRAGNVVGRIEGTGIGLASACQIVQQHGGRIDVDSEEGKGSTFTVWLPLSPVDEERPPADESDRRPAEATQ